MAYEENDASVIEELETEIAAFEEKFEETRIRTLLSGERRRRLIDMLSSGAAGAVCVNLQIILINLDINVIFNIREKSRKSDSEIRYVLMLCSRIRL